MKITWSAARSRALGIFIGAVIFFVVLSIKACADIVEFGHPVDMHIHMPEQGVIIQETPSPEQTKSYNEAKERINQGKGTEKDYQKVYEWQRDFMVSNDGGGTSGNNEGTFSTEHTSHDHDG